MMTDAAINPTWAVLLPVLIGGGLTILGGLVGPFVQYALSGRRSVQEKRAGRFEAMLQAIYDHNHWLDRQKDVRAWGAAFDPGPSPIDKARSIVLIDFPELRLAVRQLDVASSTYQQWMTEAASRRLRGEREKIGEGFLEAYGTWLNAFVAFENEAAEYYQKRKGKV